MNHNEEKSQSVEIDSEMTYLIELVGKALQTISITFFSMHFMFYDLEE